MYSEDDICNAAVAFGVLRNWVDEVLSFQDLKEISLPLSKTDRVVP